MKIVVVGSTGLIGSKLVTALRVKDQEVVGASPDSGVNTITGDGLAVALARARIVVDVTNSPSLDSEAAIAFFTTSTRNLLAAEAAAGVEHHVALSIVGTDRLQESGYFRGKLLQEHLIKASGLPYTILRSTQFFEFIGRIADFNSDGTTVRIPPAFVQPILSDEVVGALVDVALGPPVNDIVEVAGPDRFRLDDLIRRVLHARHDPRNVTADVRARYFGAELDDRSLVPGVNPRVTMTHFETWLDLATEQK